jgi:hypothetical protein
MFGTFENNLTLFCVCAGCNNSFSKLELFLGRDSAEAIQRVRFGLKPPAAAKKIRGTRLTFRADQPGPWFGAYAVLDGDESSVFPAFLPQAAFRASTTGDWEWILADDFSSKRLANYPPSSQIRVAGGSSAELIQTVEMLERFGYKFGSREVTEVPTGAENGNFHIRVEGVIDEPILRAIAKVAFNYLAWTNGPSIVLREEFDAIRSFIRGGVPTGWQVVEVRREPILQNEKTGGRITDGHLLMVGWGPGGALPVAKVAFFNGVTYVVHLCSEVFGPLPLKIGGHHFHPTLRVIDALSTEPPQSASQNEER